MAIQKQDVVHFTAQNGKAFLCLAGPTLVGVLMYAVLNSTPGQASGASAAAVVVCVALLFLGWIPGIALMAMFGRTYQRQILEAGREAFVKMIGTEPRYIDVAVHTRSPFGIAYDGKRFYMMDDGAGVSFDFEDVRSYFWKIDGYDAVVVYGGRPGDGFSAGLDNAQAAVRAARTSGFFVDLKDVDHPMWQFQSTDERLLKRWCEIFNQHREARLRVPLVPAQAA